MTFALIMGGLFILYYALRKELPIKTLIKIPFCTFSFEANGSEQKPKLTNELKNVSAAPPPDHPVVAGPVRHADRVNGNDRRSRDA
ncbi:MAG: hypothetical protein ABSG41_25590 [Bryobacteraceae bacterium]